MVAQSSSFDRTAARDGRFDGRFIVGVVSTGIYCLPSCAARPPKPENIRLFGTEADALAAGLRACKRCRPDLFYRGEDVDTALFTALAARVRAAPADYADTGALARASGISIAKLGDLLRAHAHQTPAAWLRRERVRDASRRLLRGHEKIVDVGYAAGFDSEAAFHRQFLALTRMTPGAYRTLAGARIFLLQLPAGFRDHEVLAYHARDSQSPCERVDGRRIFKALETPDGALVLEISLEAQGAWCRVHTDTVLGIDTMQALQATALRMLGLTADVGAFESRAARGTPLAVLLERRRGLRLPLTPTVFDGLCWAIVGQQINIAFASSLRREILALAGRRVGHMRAHPVAARIADIDVSALTRRRFSRSKAEYLIGAAREVASGRLPVEELGDDSAVAVHKRLTAIHGIGVWTARYVMMRGAGFADCAPVGDVALAAALQRLTAQPDRPDARQVEALMQPYAPFRSLATNHLWASLGDAA